MRIAKCRAARGMSQSQLGAQMGVSQNTVSDWEHEVILPQTRRLPDLAHVLGVDIGELFADNGNPYTVPDSWPEHEEYGFG